MAKKTSKQKKAAPKKAVKKTVKKASPAKKTTVQKKEKEPVVKTPTPKTEPVAETKKADFNADVATTVNKPATTITHTVNTDRTRRVVSTQKTPESVDNVAELERIFQSTYRRANRSELPEARHIEEWIKKLNPEAQVLIDRPSKGVRVQAAFTVTVGDVTRRMPTDGFWSTSG